MRSFSEYNPIVITVWFFSVTGITMFSTYPLLMAMSLIGGVLFFTVRNGLSHGREHIFFWLLFAVLAIANPLISHNGRTVLFVMNHNPVTLEAALYGLNSAAMITGVLYWFRSLTQIMTSEKLLYITGALSPKLSLVISMALRFVPLFSRQSVKINNAQKAMGLYKDDNIIDDIKGRSRVFSILVTWALENGIITADSMEARGFGVHRRTQLKQFGFRTVDIILLTASLLLTGITAAAVGTGALSFEFYPSLKAELPGILGAAGLVSYGVLILLPIIIETEACLRWKYLRSVI
ncbi:MAG: energy-coupling factor transporter transmembrane protein EcfT [Ruminococcus sp.]|nr:energy-coupling factor transporter transmembrane protein EcfT [Ruminococcus sp.]